TTSEKEAEWLRLHCVEGTTQELNEDEELEERIRESMEGWYPDCIIGRESLESNDSDDDDDDLDDFTAPENSSPSSERLQIAAGGIPLPPDEAERSPKIQVAAKDRATLDGILAELENPDTSAERKSELREEYSGIAQPYVDAGILGKMEKDPEFEFAKRAIAWLRAEIEKPGTSPERKAELREDIGCIADTYANQGVDDDFDSPIAESRPDDATNNLGRLDSEAFFFKCLFAEDIPNRPGFWAYRQTNDGSLMEVELTRSEWLRWRNLLADTFPKSRGGN
ncbi:MAG: hypothetical protein ACOYM3_21135, partial [Terrimicrobiaceae bacterium]